jgi:hypothetical protein
MIAGTATKPGQAISSDSTTWESEIDAQMSEFPLGYPRRKSNLTPDRREYPHRFRFPFFLAVSSPVTTGPIGRSRQVNAARTPQRAYRQNDLP